MFELGSPAPNKFHVSIGTALLIIVLKFINDYYAENQKYIYYPTETFIFLPQRDSQIHSLSFFKHNFFLLKGGQYYNDP